MCNMELELINETLPLTTNNAKKYQRSVTLASQLSMGNKILNKIELMQSKDIPSKSSLLYAINVNI